MNFTVPTSVQNIYLYCTERTVYHIYIVSSHKLFILNLRKRIEMSFEIGVLSFIILVLCDSFVHIETNFFCILYASQECAKC